MDVFLNVGALIVILASILLYGYLIGRLNVTKLWKTRRGGILFGSFLWDLLVSLCILIPIAIDQYSDKSTELEENILSANLLHSLTPLRQMAIVAGHWHVITVLAHQFWLLRDTLDQHRVRQSRFPDYRFCVIIIGLISFVLIGPSYFNEYKLYHSTELDANESQLCTGWTVKRMTDVTNTVIVLDTILWFILESPIPFMLCVSLCVMIYRAIHQICFLSHVVVAAPQAKRSAMKLILLILFKQLAMLVRPFAISPLFFDSHNTFNYSPLTCLNDQQSKSINQSIDLLILLFNILTNPPLYWDMIEQQRNCWLPLQASLLVDRKNKLSAQSGIAKSSYGSTVSQVSSYFQKRSAGAKEGLLTKAENDNLRAKWEAALKSNATNIGTLFLRQFLEDHPQIVGVLFGEGAEKIRYQDNDRFMKIADQIQLFLDTIIKSTQLQSAEGLKECTHKWHNLGAIHCRHGVNIAADDWESITRILIRYLLPNDSAMNTEHSALKKSVDRFLSRLALETNAGYIKELLNRPMAHPVARQSISVPSASHISITCTERPHNPSVQSSCQDPQGDTSSIQDNPFGANDQSGDLRRLALRSASLRHKKNKIDQNLLQSVTSRPRSASVYDDEDETPL